MVTVKQAMDKFRIISHQSTNKDGWQHSEGIVDMIIHEWGICFAFRKKKHGCSSKRYPALVNKNLSKHEMQREFQLRNIYYVRATSKLSDSTSYHDIQYQQHGDLTPIYD